MGEERRCAASALVPISRHPERNVFPPSKRRGAQQDDSDDDEEVSDEDSEEDEDEDDEEGEGGPELTRAERRELKKKQAAERENKEGKRGEGTDDDGGDKDEDELIANPNHVTKRLNISDLSAPRELTRRERYVSVPLCPFTGAIFFSFPFVLTIFPLLCVGSRRRRRRPRIGIGRYSNAG